jgi:predicted phage terminase large subunit-like protein
VLFRTFSHPPGGASFVSGTSPSERDRRFESLFLHQRVSLAQRWGVDLVIIEDTASGMSQISLLKEHAPLNVIGRHPGADKVTRMSRQQGRFEAGRILLPNEASWLADFENELLAFPYGRYDDQVDALLLFLDWFAANEPYYRPVIGYPEVIVRQTDPFPWEPTPASRCGLPCPGSGCGAADWSAR